MANASQKTLYGKKTPAEVRAAIQVLCEEGNYDPFRELIRLATETVETEIDGRMVNLPICTVDQKIAIAKEVASYIAPKIKNIEIKQEVTGEFTFKIEQFSTSGKSKTVVASQATKAFARQGVKILEAEIIEEPKMLTEPQEQVA